MTPLSAGSVAPGYTALRHGAAWIDLPGRAKLAVRGPDRARLLHALTTNDIGSLQPGQGCYTFFLNAQGKVLADATIFCLPNQLLVDAEPEAAATLRDHIDRYLIADDAAVLDLGADLATLSVEGPATAPVLAALGLEAAPLDYAIQEWRHGFAADASTTGQPGRLLFLPTHVRPHVIEELARAGAVPTTAEDARTVRIENGIPRFGEEITSRFLAPETGRNHAIHPRKGCYLGQEIVERVRSRGFLARLLMPLLFDSPEPPAPGSRLFLGDQRAAELMSAVYSPHLQTAVGMAYVRLDAAKPGTVLSCGPGGATARIVES
jgi:aminomethyltransferase